jgi:TonB family protein
MQKSMGMLGMRGKMESRLAEDKSATAEELQVPKKKDEAQKINIISVTVGKGLTKNEILKVGEANLSEIEKCFAGKNLSGNINLNLTINADGTVKNVEIASGTIKDAQVKQCIITQVKQWRFPSTTNGQAVKTSITISVPLGRG